MALLFLLSATVNCRIDDICNDATQNELHRAQARLVREPRPRRDHGALGQSVALIDSKQRVQLQRNRDHSDNRHNTRDARDFVRAASGVIFGCDGLVGFVLIAARVLAGEKPSGEGCVPVDFPAAVEETDTQGEPPTDQNRLTDDQETGQVWEERDGDIDEENEQEMDRNHGSEELDILETV